MARTGRPGLSPKQKRELWARWRRGESVSEIGRALGKQAGSIYGVLAASGGITPPARSRSDRTLSLREREEISRCVARGLGIRAIAKRLKRSPSTICREIARHGGRSRYRAARADDRAWENARRPKKVILATHTALRKLVAAKLQEDWSPEQIAGWLATKYPRSSAMRISHETIYRTLYLRAKGALEKELIRRLRTKRKMRKGKKSSTRGQTRGQIIEAVSIHDRPAAFTSRSRPGHWEGDLITGRGNTHVATLVERRSRYLLLVRVEGRTPRASLAHSSAR